MVTRKKISSALALKVEFASDRTCCYCRIPGKPIQIAHIDDNPSNNSFDNLAILCLDHHDEAHRKGGLGRNLTPEIVRLYNQTWRELVKGKLLPDEDVRDLREYQQEVMLEINLVCQDWVTTFLTNAESLGAFLFKQEKRTLTYLSQNAKYPHSSANWERLYPLANEHLKPIVERLERIFALHGQVIPVPMKTLMTRSIRWLINFPNAYSFQYLAGELSKGISEEEEQYISFEGVFQTLKILDDEANNIREKTALTE